MTDKIASMRRRRRRHRRRRQRQQRRRLTAVAGTLDPVPHSTSPSTEQSGSIRRRSCLRFLLFYDPVSSTAANSSSIQAHSGTPIPGQCLSVDGSSVGLSERYLLHLLLFHVALKHSFSCMEYVWYNVCTMIVVCSNREGAVGKHLKEGRNTGPPLGSLERNDFMRFTTSPSSSSYDADERVGCWVSLWLAGWLSW